MATFYVGKYLADDGPPTDLQAWGFPDNLEHIKETSNVEDLLANPEDFNLFPLEAQAGSEEWGNIIFSTDTWEQPTIPDALFYGFYYGEEIAVDDFYVEIIEDLL